MKYIKNQPAIKIRNADAGTDEVDFKFHSWLVSAIHSNQIFGKGLKNIMQGAKIVTDIKDQKDAEYIKLEDDDFAKLKESVEMCQWIPRVAMELIPFSKSLEAALDKLPETQEA